MVDLDTIRLTSEDMWQSALVTALIDVILVTFLAWRINRERFHRLRWPLAVAAGLFWGIFAIALYQIFWDSYYRYFGASWMRDGGILLVMIPVAAGLALLFHWLALCLPGIPLVTFCILVGLESVVEHVWGFYDLKILDIPMLEGVSQASILAFAFPEYILYWCVIIGTAAIVQAIWNRIFRKIRYGQAILR
jgi:hypothetical protein